MVLLRQDLNDSCCSSSSATILNIMVNRNCCLISFIRKYSQFWISFAAENKKLVKTVQINSTTGKNCFGSFQFRISSTESKVKPASCIESKQHQKEVLNISFHSKVWISSTDWKDNPTSNINRRHVTGKNYLTISFPKLQEKIMMMMMMITIIIPLHKKLLQFDWLRAVVFQLNLKYLHVKITTFCR